MELSNLSPRDPAIMHFQFRQYQQQQLYPLSRFPSVSLNILFRSNNFAGPLFQGNIINAATSDG